MNSALIIEERDPLALILQASRSVDLRLIDRFLDMIKHLYQFSIFHPILDLAATKVLDGLLSFDLHDQRFFDLDEGNCKTIYGNSVDRLWNKIRNNNKYCITIKKLSYPVIIHETAHMVEKELAIDMSAFIEIIKKDLSSLPTSVAMNKMVTQVMLIEVNAYPPDQQASELFARYFQMLCMSKDIAGLSIQGAYNLDRIIDYFSNTSQWWRYNLISTFKELINPLISNASQKLIKKIDDVQHKWSEQTVNAMHGKRDKAKWSRAIKSIKSNS
jgi:hypothetical protein